MEVSNFHYCLFQNIRELLNSWIDLSYQRILKLVLEYLKMSHEFFFV